MDNEKTTPSHSCLEINFNPSIEPLVAKYLDYLNRVEAMGQRTDLTPAEKAVIDFARERLAEVESALFPPHFWQRKKVFAAWQLLHRVGEEMILLMDKDELAAYATRLKLEVKTVTLAGDLNKCWDTEITTALKDITPGDKNAGKQNQAHVSSAEHKPSPASEENYAGKLNHARHLCKSIHRSINAIVDDSFWDLWAKKSIALTYTVLLIGLSATLFAIMGTGCLTIPVILLLGAIGGLMSGIITGERETIPKGHFWVPTIYYILVRPTLGAMAAMVIFWMVESQFLIRIKPPLTQELQAFSYYSGAGTVHGTTTLPPSQEPRDARPKPPPKATGGRWARPAYTEADRRSRSSWCGRSCPCSGRPPPLKCRWVEID